MIRVGIIGTGNISRCHMAGYRILPNIKVVAACDIDLEKAKRYAAEYGIENVYSDYNEMLAKENLDAVSVCTWNCVHKDASVAALRAGANVLCEKPMAMNRFEAFEMEKASEETGKLLMIGFCRRFSNDTAVVDKYIKNGDLGDIYYAKAAYLRRDGCPGGWFGDKRYSGGGPLIDVGVHAMDIVRYFAGNPNPVTAYGFTYDNLGPNRANGGIKNNPETKFQHNVEDLCGGMVKFDNGLTMFIESSFNLNVGEGRGDVELFGTKGGVTIRPDVVLHTEKAGMYVEIKTSNSASRFEGLFENEIRHFIDCVANNIPCKSPAKDGVALMKIIDAIYESAETGKLVEID